MSRAQKTGVTKPTPVTSSGIKAVAPHTWKEKIHPEDYENLKNTFDLFDEDHSGSIDPEEINKILEELGPDRRTSFIYGIIEGLKAKNRAINF